MRPSSMVPLSKVKVKRVEGQLVLFIAGKKQQRPPFHSTLAVLERLSTHKGTIVPYALLTLVMESKSPGDPRSLHVLRQYIRELKILFRKERIAAYIAVAETVGYGLCESYT